MRRIFFLVKFFNNPNYAEDLVRGRIFAQRLFKFKQTENGDESGRMDRPEWTRLGSNVRYLRCEVESVRNSYGTRAIE